MLERVRHKTEVRRDNIVRLLMSFGFDSRKGSNHIVFTYQDIMIPIPHERRLGRPYVKIVVKRLDEIISNEKGAGDAGN